MSHTENEKTLTRTGAKKDLIPNLKGNQDLIKILKNMGEKGKISIRNIRREANEDLKKKLKDKIIKEDENKDFEKNIQKLTDSNISGIDKILIDKEKEILQIWINSTTLPLLWMVMEGGVKKRIKEEILDI